MSNVEDVKPLKNNKEGNIAESKQILLNTCNKTGSDKTQPHTLIGNCSDALVKELLDLSVSKYNSVESESHSYSVILNDPHVTEGQPDSLIESKNCSDELVGEDYGNMYSFVISKDRNPSDFNELIKFMNLGYKHLKLRASKRSLLPDEEISLKRFASDSPITNDAPKEKVSISTQTDDFTEKSTERHSRKKLIQMPEKASIPTQTDVFTRKPSERHSQKKLIQMPEKASIPAQTDDVFSRKPSEMHSQKKLIQMPEKASIPTQTDVFSRKPSERHSQKKLIQMPAKASIPAQTNDVFSRKPSERHSQEESTKFDIPIRKTNEYSEIKNHLNYFIHLIDLLTINTSDMVNFFKGKTLITSLYEEPCKYKLKNQNGIPVEQLVVVPPEFKTGIETRSAKKLKETFEKWLCQRQKHGNKGKCCLLKKDELIKVADSRLHTDIIKLLRASDKNGPATVMTPKSGPNSVISSVVIPKRVQPSSTTRTNVPHNRFPRVEVPSLRFLSNKDESQSTTTKQEQSLKSASTNRPTSCRVKTNSSEFVRELLLHNIGFKVTRSTKRLYLYLNILIVEIGILQCDILICVDFVNKKILQYCDQHVLEEVYYHTWDLMSIIEIFLNLLKDCSILLKIYPTSIDRKLFVLKIKYHIGGCFKKLLQESYDLMSHLKDIFLDSPVK